MAEQCAVHADPLEAAEHVWLVARVVNVDRDTEGVQLFGHLRCTVDHRGFQGEVAALPEQRLIVRLRVFAGEEHRALLHRRTRLIHIPALLPETGETDLADCAEITERCHHRTRRDIGRRERLLQHRQLQRITLLFLIRAVRFRCPRREAEFRFRTRLR